MASDETAAFSAADVDTKRLPANNAYDGLVGLREYSTTAQYGVVESGTLIASPSMLVRGMAGRGVK